MVGDHRIGADGRASAYDRPMKDDAARSSQRFVLERAPFEVGEVADHAAVPDHSREAGPGVDDRAVLNGRAAPTVIVP